MNTKDRLSQVHWDLVLRAAVLIYIGTFILGVATSLPLIAFFKQSQLDSPTAFQASSWISALLVVVVTAYGAWRVARRVERAPLLHGALVGVAVALLSLLLDVLFIRAIGPVGLLLYALMVAAGSLGGVLGSWRREQV